MRRHALCTLAALLTACLVLSACTSGAGPGVAPTPDGASSSATTAPTPAGPVTLRLAVHGDAPLRRAWDELAAAFEAQNPGSEVVVEHSGSEEQATRNLRDQVADGDAPDVFVASNETVPGMVAAGQVRPLDQLLEQRGLEFGDRYQRLGLVALAAEQSLQCMPYDVSPLVVFYHPGLVPFRRLTEPGDEPLTPETGWTWDQFGRAARLMSQDGVKGAYVPPELAVIMALVRSAGDDIVDDPRDATTLTLADDGTRAALEDVLAVVRDKRITPTQGQLDRRSAFRRFTQERLGMLIGSRAMVPRLRKVEDLDFDVFPLPGLARNVTVADVNGLCISADSEHVAAAADLMAFASRERGAAILAESGAVVPAHLPTLNSASFTQPGTRPASVAVFGEAVRQATVAPFVTGWPELERVMAPEFETMFYDPLINLDTLLPRLDLQSQRILAPVTTEAP